MQKSFRDLAVFQLGIELMVMVYEATDMFPRREIYGLVSQLRRAAVSVISQLGEGHGRLTFGERRQFLSQARGSLYEIEAQCIAAVRLGFMSTEHASKIERQRKRTVSALEGLIEWVRSREGKRSGPATRRLGDPATT